MYIAETTKRPPHMKQAQARYKKRHKQLNIALNLEKDKDLIQSIENDNKRSLNSLVKSLLYAHYGVQPNQPQ